MAIDLNSAVKMRSCDRPPLICVHGGPGVGKTTFASKVPGLVFIRCEDGLGSIQANAFDLATTYADVMDQLRALLEQQHNYRWVCIDTLSAFEPMIWAAVVATADNATQNRSIRKLEDIGYGKGYAMALDYWGEFIAMCKQLMTRRGMGVILLAHSDIVRHETPDMDGYDRTQIKLHKRAFHLLYEQCDIIGYAAKKVYLKKETINKDRSRNMGVDSNLRILHLVERPAFVAKNRYAMPDEVPLDWGAFYGALIQSITPQQPTAA